MEQFEQKCEQLRHLYVLEKHRLQSYKDWPFGENDACSVVKMAEAGFYFSGIRHDDDSVTCFVCAKSLDGWVRTDDPWLEHKKHAPQCLFSKFGRKERDLTVEEFIQVYGVVLTNHISSRLSKEKAALQSAASVELEAFLRKK